METDPAGSDCSEPAFLDPARAGNRCLAFPHRRDVRSRGGGATIPAPHAGPLAARRARRALTGIAMLALLGLWAWPWAMRLEHPLIHADDVQRVIDLQTLPLSLRLTRPFNEHLAILFELVTALTWEAAGHRLSALPAAFTVVSLVPLALSAVMLWRLLRREWESPAVAALGVTILVVTPIHAECAYWFSASTFSWALLLTIVALDRVSAAARDDRRSSWLACALACFLAPMGSAIGVLAGPACLLRGWPTSWRSRSAWILTPILGTAANLLLARSLAPGSGRSATRPGLAGIMAGLEQALVAPLHLVTQGYAGIELPETLLNPRIGSGFLLVLICALGWLGPRGSGSSRRWLAAGSFLLLAGYALTYGSRTEQVGAEQLLRVQRYHLFPCLGLAIIVATALGSMSRDWLDRHPGGGLFLVLVLASMLALVNHGGFESRMRLYELLPGQSDFLAMIDRLGVVIRDHGISRVQAIEALEPLEPRWSSPGYNVLRMLASPAPAAVESPAADSASVRDTILEAMSLGDRVMLHAGCDLTRALQPRGLAATPATPSRRSRSIRLKPAGVRDEIYDCEGWPDFVEFELPRTPGDAPSTLVFPELTPGRTIEVWWKGRSQTWSEARSMLLRKPSTFAEREPVELPLVRIPQLDSENLVTIRLTVREAGRVAIGAPGLSR